MAGAFTMGFGVMASVFTNNVAALAALANGMLPLRRIAQERVEQESKQELRLMYNGACLICHCVVNSLTARPQNHSPIHCRSNPCHWRNALRLN